MNWRPVIARVKAALKRRGRTDQDAEDILQEAWMRLHRFQQDQEVAQPEAFLMRTALNLSVDAHRARQGRGEAVALDDVVLIDTAPSAESILLARERVARLSVCLGRLPEKTRTIFLAHRLEGKTYPEIAREQGLSVSTIEQHVAKAVLQLTAWMEGW